MDTHFIGLSLSGGTTVDVDGGYKWLYLVPAVACLLSGAATVVLSANSSPVGLAVGSYLAIGYAGTAVLSASLFEINTSKAGVGMMMRLGTWNMTWPIAVVGYPLVFGTLSAFVAQSPLLQDVQFRRLNRDG